MLVKEWKFFLEMVDVIKYFDEFCEVEIFFKLVVVIYFVCDINFSWNKFMESKEKLIYFVDYFDLCLFSIFVVF